MIQLTAIAAGHKSFHDDVHVCTNRLFVLHAQFRGDGVLGVKSGRFTHSFVQKQGDDPAMKEARTALVFFSDPETTHDTLARVVPLKGEMHPAGVCAAASKARVIGFWIELHCSFAVPA